MMVSVNLRLISGLWVILASSLLVADDDPIGAKLDMARQRYEDTMSDVNEKVLQHLERRQEIARKSGDLAMLAEIEDALTKFQQSKIFPDDVPAILFRRASRAHGAFELACDVAVKSYTQAGRESEAQQVSDLLARLQKIGLERATRFNGEVRITAKQEIGYDIGKINKNDRIRLSYVGGTWKGWGNLASDSPDAKKLEKGNRNRLVICQADARGRTRVLAIVPPGTRYQPFEWAANRDYERLVLRINDNDGDFGSNPDRNVRYNLHVLRGP